MAETNTSRDFRKYEVWKKSIEFASFVYKVTGGLPWFEKKGLCDQLQRAAVSISSNIAEGAARPSDNDFAHFLDIALGSAYEVETQMQIAKNIGYIDEERHSKLLEEVIDIEKQISRLIRHIRYTQ